MREKAKEEKKEGKKDWEKERKKMILTPVKKLLSLILDTQNYSYALARIMKEREKKR